MGRTHLVQFVQERDLRLVRLEARLAGRARWVRLLRHLSHRAPGAHRLSARLWSLVPKTDMCMHMRMHMHMHMLTCTVHMPCWRLARIILDRTGSERHIVFSEVWASEGFPRILRDFSKPRTTLRIVRGTQVAHRTPPPLLGRSGGGF